MNYLALLNYLFYGLDESYSDSRAHCFGEVSSADWGRFDERVCLREDSVAPLEAPIVVRIIEHNGFYASIRGAGLNFETLRRTGRHHSLVEDGEVPGQTIVLHLVVDSLSDGSTICEQSDLIDLSTVL